MQFFVDYKVILLIFILLANGISANFKHILLDRKDNFQPCQFYDDIINCNFRNLLDTYENFTVKVNLNGIKVKLINILNMRLTKIPKNFITCDSEIESLVVVSWIDVVEINPQAFDSCTTFRSIELTSLHIRGNKVPIVLDNVFSQLKHLKSLALHNFYITELKSKTLENQKQFESLTVNNKEFTTISPNLFSRQHLLKELKITQMDNGQILMDQLANWPSSGFRVDTVIFDANGLEKFPTFNKYFGESITSLSVGKNKIKLISTSDNQYLPNLHTLVLSENLLTTTSCNGLTSFTNLTSLSLNKISTLTDFPKSIEYLKNLKYLYVDDANFERISTTLPPNIVGFGAINMPRLIYINPDFFSKVVDLQMLNLPSLQAIHSEYLLKHLSRFQNKIELVVMDKVEMNLNELWTFLGNMTNLQVLFLRNVAIQSIPGWVLHNWRSMERLYLEGDFLKPALFNVPEFQELSSRVSVLDLSSNFDLQSLPRCAFYGMKDIQNKLILNKVSLVCDCNMKWLRQQVEADKSKNWKGLNFPCANEPNVYFLTKPLASFDQCADGGQIRSCMPAKSGSYPIEFGVHFHNGSLVAENITGNYLKDYFDGISVIVHHSNDAASQIYSDKNKKYSLNVNSIKVDYQYNFMNLQKQHFRVCLELIKSAERFEYDYNCKAVDVENKLSGGISGGEGGENGAGDGQTKLRWMVTVVGIICGNVVLVLGIILIIICICRHRKPHHHSEDDFDIKFKSDAENIDGDNCSHYSEPVESVYSGDHYTYITDENMADKSQSVYLDDSMMSHTYDAFVPATLPIRNHTTSSGSSSNQPTSWLDHPSNLVRPPKIRSYRQPLHRSCKHKSRIQDKIEASIRRSLHSISRSKSNESFNDQPSQPLPQHLSQSMHSLPQNYLTRDLPPLPKPRLPSQDLSTLISNADKHFNNYLLQDPNSKYDMHNNHEYIRNESDSGLDVSRLTNDPDRSTTTIIM